MPAAQVVAQGPVGSPTRRRATDPGSPLLGPAGAPRLAGSAPSSPPVVPGCRASSPVRLPLTAGRLPRSRNLSAVASPVTDGNQLRRCLAGSAGGVQEQAQQAAAGDSCSGGLPAGQADSYHACLANLFEQRFCPLRLGMQRQSVDAEPANLHAHLPGMPQLAPPAAQQLHQWQREQQQQRQQQLGSPPCSPLPGTPAAVPGEAAAAAAAASQDADAVAGLCSSGSSALSYASEERDVVQVASPSGGARTQLSPGWPRYV